jgi:hypothetical protein
MDSSYYNFPNLNMYLNDDEVKELEDLNKKSNRAQNSLKDNNDPFSMSISKLIVIWRLKNLEVFKDLVNLFSNFEAKYSDYFNDIDETKQWFSGIMIILKDIFKIFTKDNRAIYIGMTLLIISFLLNIIDISS